MGLSAGTRPLPYGHQRDAAMDIDGLDVSLLSTLPSPPPSADSRNSY